ncbi:unnamed protein product [Prorocentrum cordatum]|uniref:Uncharacterized protein n=1 Tax=Prorocentrum cordatum TaxID=2364126 RepID=A0ABN9TLL3_9DINO|nr:unnamed protein product [Polarella glacialis]
MKKRHTVEHLGWIHNVRDRVLHHGAAGHKEVSESDLQFNAGELFVKMKLVRVAPYGSDVIFSHAIQPPFAWFNKVIHEEHLPELDFQEMFDDAMDIKYAVVDDCVLCFASYIWYLLSWQSKTLSGLISLALCVAAWKQSLIYACLWAIATVLLLLNGFGVQRQKMTTSGLNAPLNNKGFEIVAGWNSILQMEAFLLRVVIHKGGEVESERELRDFVTRGFRKGISSFTLQDVIHVLKDMDWVTPRGKNVEEAKIKPGSMVRIHERRRATVDKVFPPEQGTDRKRIEVHYDELEQHEETTAEICYEDELHVRTVMPQVPKVLLSGKVKQNIRKIGWQLDSGKKSNLLPVLRLISDVLTWKRPLLTALIAIYLVFRLVMAVLALCHPKNGFVTSFVWVMRNAGNIFLFAAVVASFILFAQPLNWLIPLIRMLSGWLVSKRRAPAIWAFHTPHLDLACATKRLPGPQEPHGPSNAELGDGVDEESGGASVASKEAAAPLLRRPGARRAWLPCAGRAPREDGE